MYNKGSTLHKDNTDTKTVKIKEKAMSPHNNKLNVYIYIYQEKIKAFYRNQFIKIVLVNSFVESKN